MGEREEIFTNMIFDVVQFFLSLCVCITNMGLVGRSQTDGPELPRLLPGERQVRGGGAAVRERRSPVCSDGGLQGGRDHGPPEGGAQGQDGLQQAVLGLQHHTRGRQLLDRV